MTDIYRARTMRDTFLDWAALIDDLISNSPIEHQAVYNGSITKKTEEAVLDYLAAHEPATTKEIFDAIEPTIPIGGKNPLNTLSSRLSLSRRIRRDPMGWVRA